ncbi:MAG: SDR family oxidoreductase [Pedobacter sp.]|nr:MAG: SDR family oxidoreductase [Pedobacter sp.]
MSKVILITGTSQGFGKLTAKALAVQGTQVIATMRKISSKNAKQAKELDAIENIEVVELDVTSTASIKSAIDQIYLKYGRIDIWINNAGVMGVGLMEATSIERMRSMFEINLWGTIQCTQAVLPIMRRQRSGLIVNLTSGLGIIGAPFTAAYAAAKFAVEGFTESLRYEIKDFGIEIGTVQPGAFPTSLASSGEYDADLFKINEEYGSQTKNKLQEFGENLYAKQTAFAMNPQEVAETLKHLVELNSGKRPYFTSVNRVTGNLEQEMMNKKILANTEWMTRMGWGNLT